MLYRPALLFHLIVLTGSSPAFSAPVYTWVDPDGVTHFSETPPEDPAIQPRQLELLPPSAAGDNIADDYYSIANQAERMAARRLERLEADAARLRAQADAVRAATEAQAAVPPATTGDTGNIYYYPLPYNPYNPGSRRPRHYRNPHYRTHTVEPAPPPRRLNKPIRNTR